MGGKTSASVKNKWIANAYDRINLTVPKGQKDVIKACATAQGESVNEYIKKAIEARMEREGSALHAGAVSISQSQSTENPDGSCPLSHTEDSPKGEN